MRGRNSAVAGFVNARSDSPARDASLCRRRPGGVWGDGL